MPYTFELIFAGLCLFMLQPPVVDDQYHELVVHVVETRDKHPSYCEPEVKLPGHKPWLESVAPYANESFQNWICSPRSGCPLLDKDLCLSIIDPAGRPLPPPGSPSVKPVRDRGVGDESPVDPPTDRPDSFDWIAHMRLLDATLPVLKTEVETDLASDTTLIAARVRSQWGAVGTNSHTRAQGTGPYVKWIVTPGGRQPAQRDHPKSLAEEIYLRVDIPGGHKVRLHECAAAGNYVEFEPEEDQTKVTVRVTNQMATTRLCANVHERGPSPWRLRHYLWYYELLDWQADKSDCPAFLAAPTCPGNTCRRDRRPQRCGNVADKRSLAKPPADGNYFCPPATYP